MSGVLNTVRKVFAEGEILREEIRLHGENAYNELGSECTNFMMDVDNKYYNTKFDMNSKIDACKVDFIKYSDDFKMTLTNKGEAYIKNLNNLGVRYIADINNISGEYPLASKLNGIEASKLALKKHISLRLPEEYCVFYANYKKSIHGYNYKLNSHHKVIGDKLIGIDTGIVYSADKKAYFQKIENEGIWFGIGTENMMWGINFEQLGGNHPDAVLNEKYGERTFSFDFNRGAGQGNRYRHTSVILFSEYLTFSINTIKINSDRGIVHRLLYTHMPGWNQLIVNSIAYNTPTQASCIVPNLKYVVSGIEYQGDRGTISVTNDGASYGTVEFKMQVELDIPIATPFVNKSREQSRIYYNDIPNRKSIIIKCKKINPLNDTFILYADDEIRITGKKDIREFFNRAEDNVLIINLQSKRVYINGIEIERNKYWLIEADSIGVIIDESLETTELSRKRYMSEIGDNSKFKGVTIDESLETTELNRRGDE